VTTIVSLLLCIALGVALYWCREWRIRCELAREERDAYRDDDSWQSLAKTLSEENRILRDALNARGE
jgi:hypothetical protein